MFSYYPLRIYSWTEYIFAVSRRYLKYFYTFHGHYCVCINVHKLEIYTKLDYFDDYIIIPMIIHTRVYELFIIQG